jgi:hypothetical protein
MFLASGAARYDHSPYQYTWRDTAPDDAGGYASAFWAKAHGYTRGAAVFSNNIGAQSFVPTLTSGYKKLGGSLVVTQSLAPGQTSYRSEVESLAAQSPQVIFTEADAQTDATYLSEEKQLTGKVLPIIGTGNDLTTAWYKAVSGAIGAKTLSQKFLALQFYSPQIGPSYAAFKSALLGSAAQGRSWLKKWITDPFAQSCYDDITMMSLAMLAAHSLDPSIYNRYIKTVTTASPGAVVVHTFAEGKTALAAGKKIQYVGSTGAFAFDKWNNSPGVFQGVKFGPTGQAIVVGHITASQLNSAKS